MYSHIIDLDSNRSISEVSHTFKRNDLFEEYTLRSFLSALLAIVGHRIIFIVFGVQYYQIGKPFDAGTLLIDLGGYTALFGVFYWLLGRFKLLRPKDGG